MPRVSQTNLVDFHGQVFNVITLRDGKIVHIQDYTRREEAVMAAGAADRANWR